MGRAPGGMPLDAGEALPSIGETFVDVWNLLQGTDQERVPEFLGSVFELALDATVRHTSGAHYTGETGIARVLGPTVLSPWRDRIASIRTPEDAERVVRQMKAFHVLDPACGCGNFLYGVYRAMKRLEAALVTRWLGVQRAVPRRVHGVRPPPPRPCFTLAQLHGIENNLDAAWLARRVVSLGHRLASCELGLDDQGLPRGSLDDTILHADALLVDWPRPEGELAIVGNPPYLGVRKMRSELGDAYVDAIHARYPDNRAADYVTYWFTRALEVLRPGERAGFVATNSIAQNESRERASTASLRRVERSPTPGNPIHGRATRRFTSRSSTG